MKSRTKIHLSGLQDCSNVVNHQEDSDNNFFFPLFFRISSIACSSVSTRPCRFFSASSSSFSRLSSSSNFSFSSAIFSAFMSGLPFALTYSYRIRPPATRRIKESPITSANRSTALLSGKGLNFRFQTLCSLGGGLSFAAACFLAVSSSFVCSS